MVRQKHHDRSQGSRVPLTLDGHPYQHVSLDTFGHGKVHLNKGTRNLLRKNQVLAVCCLTSGHLSLEPIELLTPNSISGALWRIKQTFKTRICTIYSGGHYVCPIHRCPTYRCPVYGCPIYICPICSKNPNLSHM